MLSDSSLYVLKSVKQRGQDVSSFSEINFSPFDINSFNSEFRLF